MENFFVIFQSGKNIFGLLVWNFPDLIF